MDAFIAVNPKYNDLFSKLVLNYRNIGIAVVKKWTEYDTAC